MAGADWLVLVVYNSADWLALIRQVVLIGGRLLASADALELNDRD